jgi:predicted PurR-regulated permease PerM
MRSSLPERALFVTSPSCPLRPMNSPDADSPVPAPDPGPTRDHASDPGPARDRVLDPGIMRGRRIAGACLTLILIGLGIWTLREFLAALVWAAILAVALWPSYQRAERNWPAGRRHLLPALFTLGIALVFVLPIVVAGIQVASEARTMAEWIDAALHGGVPIPGFIQHLPAFADPVRNWWQDNLADPDAAADLLTRLKQPENMLAGRKIGLAILHRLVIFGFCLLTVFFLFKDGDRLVEQLRHAGNRALGPVGERLGRQIIASIHGTVNGLVLVGLGEGVLLYVVYLFAGVSHPTLLGVATAIGAMIPFGAPLIFGLAALIAFAQGLMGGAVAIIVAGAVISFVADHFIRPVLIGSATRLPFIWVLFGILGGVATWGLLGLFLGPAIMAALILLWREWTENG